MRKVLLAILASLILFSVIGYAREDRIRIAVIDTGIDKDILGAYMCEDGHRDFTGQGLDDHLGHGTAMALAIVRSVSSKTHCLMNVKFYDPHYLAMNDLTGSVAYVAKSDAKYVNISAGGPRVDMVEYNSIKRALGKGMKFSVSAGNNGDNMDVMCNQWPACYRFKSKNFHVIGALNPFGEPAYFSNYGQAVTEWEYGVDIVLGDFVVSGTSPAAAIYTGRLAQNDYLATLN